PGYLPAPRAPQIAEETRGHRLPGPQGLTLAVPYPALSGTPAQGLTGVCPGPAVTPLCRSRRSHRRGNQWRARPALVPGEEGRLGCIGKKGATHAAFSRGVTNAEGVSHSWIAADG